MDMQIMDGGMGLELFRIGVPKDLKIWSARALVDSEYHSHVVEAHLNFLKAGANYITTNNYAVIPAYLEKVNLLDQFEALTRLSGELARQAVDTFFQLQHNAEQPMILGALPPLVESYRPDLVLPQDQTLAYYARIIEALAPYVDYYIAETLSSVDEISYAMQALQHASKPFFVSCTVNDKGQLRSQEDVNDVIRMILQSSVLPKVFLFNCSYPEFITQAFMQIQAPLMEKLQGYNIALGAYANRFAVDPSEEFNLEEESLGPQLRQDITPESYLEYTQHWQRLGCQYIGGCCGVSPDYIKYLYDYYRNQS